MRLAIFTNQFPNRVSTFFARDVRGLIDHGIEVDIFPLRPLDESLWQYVPSELSDAVLSRARIHHLGSSTGDANSSGHGASALPVEMALAASASALKYGWETTAKTIYAIRGALEWARRFPDGFDHVWSYWGNYAATSAALFHRVTSPGAPFSMTLHAGTDLYRTPVFMKQKLQYADNVFVVCEFNRTYLERHFRGVWPAISAKVQLHHLGLDLSEYSYSEAGRTPGRVLCVGSLERVKGFSDAVRAVAAVGSTDHGVHLDIIGEGPESPALRRMASELGVADRVNFRGWLKPGEVRDAMRSATILVHPSTGLGDAVPTVIKEAMALGTPVIGTQVVGIPELLADGACGVLVPPRDSRALGEAIRSLLADPDKRLRFARAARARAEGMLDVKVTSAHLAARLVESRRRPRSSREDTVSSSVSTVKN